MTANACVAARCWPSSRGNHSQCSGYVWVHEGGWATCAAALPCPCRLLLLPFARMRNDFPAQLLHGCRTPPCAPSCILLPAGKQVEVLTTLPSRPASACSAWGFSHHTTPLHTAAAPTDPVCDPTGPTDPAADPVALPRRCAAVILPRPSRAPRWRMEAAERWRRSLMRLSRRTLGQVLDTLAISDARRVSRLKGSCVGGLFFLGWGGGGGGGFTRGGVLGGGGWHQGVG
jgi:hypothetical protein